MTSQLVTQGRRHKSLQVLPGMISFSRQTLTFKYCFFEIDSYVKFCSLNRMISISIDVIQWFLNWAMGEIIESGCQTKINLLRFFAFVCLGFCINISWLHVMASCDHWAVLIILAAVGLIWLSDTVLRYNECSERMLTVATRNEIISHRFIPVFSLSIFLSFSWFYREILLQPKSFGKRNSKNIDVYQKAVFLRKDEKEIGCD